MHSVYTFSRPHAVTPANILDVQGSMGFFFTAFNSMISEG